MSGSQGRPAEGREVGPDRPTPGIRLGSSTGFITLLRHRGHRVSAALVLRGETQPTAAPAAPVRRSGPLRHSGAARRHTAGEVPVPARTWPYLASNAVTFTRSARRNFR